MPEVLVSADVVVPRTVGLLNDSGIDLLRVSPPVPQIVHGFGEPICLWAVDRPEFVLSEEEERYLL